MGKLSESLPEIVWLVQQDGYVLCMSYKHNWSDFKTVTVFSLGVPEKSFWGWNPHIQYTLIYDE
jgi:hypothetical protein